MHNDESHLQAVLGKAPLRSINRYVTRFIPARHGTTAVNAGLTTATGGRYNPPGVPALYTSLSRAVALAESTRLITDDDPLEPYLMLSLAVRSKRILDLTEATLLRQLRTTRREITAPLADPSVGTAPTQIIGRLAHTAGTIDGLLVFSARLPREINLVVFPDHLGMDYQLYDPDHVLPAVHPDIAAALMALMEI